jgi:hypothetical protein
MPKPVKPFTTMPITMQSMAERPLKRNSLQLLHMIQLLNTMLEPGETVEDPRFDQPKSP